MILKVLKIKLMGTVVNYRSHIHLLYARQERAPLSGLEESINCIVYDGSLTVYCSYLQKTDGNRILKQRGKELLINSFSTALRHYGTLLIPK